jgi:PIN domain nuclease of toxin-antitoxin system
LNDQFLVTDTHPLVWYLTNQPNKLPKKVFGAFESARKSAGSHIWVPIAVAWEVSTLLRKTNRIALPDDSFEELIMENFYFKNLTVTDLIPEDLIIAHGLRFNSDPFDSLIVATAKRLDLPLITADTEITKSKTCDVFWR